MNRRNFMKSCLAAGFISAVPGLSFAAPVAGVRTQTRLLMDTMVSISAVHASAALADEATARAFERIEALQSIFNRHDSGSALGVLNAQGYLGDAPASLKALVQDSIALHRSTGGAFDISVAPLVDLMAGVKSPSRAEIAETRSLVGISSLELSGDSLRLKKSGMALTLDGIAKGAITDEAAKTMKLAGVQNFLINSGGDIYASGEKAPGKLWKVAVESPEKDGNYPAIIELSGRGMATSGGYERPGHLVNPHEAESGQYYKSVTVTAPDAREADALATALSAMPLRSAMRFVATKENCAALFIDQKGKLHSSNWA